MAFMVELRSCELGGHAGLWLKCFVMIDLAVDGWRKGERSICFLMGQKHM